jgi:hypothetical protein
MSPEGRPGLTEKQTRLVELGNKLLSFTIECCVLLIEHDGYFSIENPEMSWLWLQTEAIMIATLPGVEFVKCYFSNFGVPFCKPTLFMHNTPTLHRLKQVVSPWPGDTVALRGLMVWEGKLQFLTHMAQAYPPILGVQFSKCVAEALQARNEALQRGLPVPLAVPEEADNLCLSLRQASWFSGLSMTSVNDTESLDVESVEVPGGLGARKGMAPLEHVAWAEGVIHPSSRPSAEVSAELIQAIHFECDHDAEEVDLFRQSELKRIIWMAKNMGEAKRAWADSAHESIRGVVQKIHGPLMQKLLAEVTGDDSHFARLMTDFHDGFPWVGPVPPCEGACRPGVPRATPTLQVTEDELKKTGTNEMRWSLASLKRLTSARTSCQQ